MFLGDVVCRWFLAKLIQPRKIWLQVVELLWHSFVHSFIYSFTVLDLKEFPFLRGNNIHWSRHWFREEICMFLSSLSTLVFYGAHKALKKAAITPRMSHSWSLFPEVQWLMRLSLPHELRGFSSPTSLFWSSWGARKMEMILAGSFRQVDAHSSLRTPWVSESGPLSKRNSALLLTTGCSFSGSWASVRLREQKSRAASLDLGFGSHLTVRAGA